MSYPLFRAVGAEEFASYHLQYNDSIPFVVIVPGFAAFLGGIAFVVDAARLRAAPGRRRCCGQAGSRRC